MNDIRKEEHDLLSEGMPILNQLGADAAKRHGIVGQAAKAQLILVLDWATDYVKVEGRGYGEGQMPHEWGSMDTYDDMRNSLRGASILMEEILDAPDDEEGQREICRRAVAESGVCAIADEVYELAYPGGDREDKEARCERWEHDNPDYTPEMEASRLATEVIRVAPLPLVEELAYATDRAKRKRTEEHEDMMRKIKNHEDLEGGLGTRALNESLFEEAT